MRLLIMSCDSRVGPPSSPAAVAVSGGRSPALLFLATDDARYITGQTLSVEGAVFLHA